MYRAWPVEHNRYLSYEIVTPSTRRFLAVCALHRRTLLSLPWYRGHIDGKQEVMIGYSDSAKDAGKMAAAWAQFNAQVWRLGMSRVCVPNSTGTVVNF